MNNFIEYFYNIKVNDIIYNTKYYSFSFNNYDYRLYFYDNYDNVSFLEEINNKLLGNTLISEIIYNINGQIISNYNNNSYVLLKLYVNADKPISLEEISFMNNSYIKDNHKSNWGLLWSKKIDYLENLINENGKKYPLVVDSFNYFVGLAENAISYYNNILDYSGVLSCICHKIIRFNDSVEVIYNPLNIIIDYRIRDVAEYIKNSFFNDNKNILQELDIYLINNNLSLMEVNLLISRILYPSFYFELYEDILIDSKEEKIIMEIISKTNEYEKYINSIIIYFKKLYNIKEIEWLKK